MLKKVFAYTHVFDPSLYYSRKHYLNLMQWQIPGVAMVSVETPFENKHVLHSVNEWTGGRYCLNITVQGKGFRDC